MTLNSDMREAIYKEMSRQDLGLRETARKMGRSHHWLGTKLRGTSPLTMEDVEEIARSLGLDPLPFFMDVASRAKNTSTIIRSSGDEPGR